MTNPALVDALQELANGGESGWESLSLPIPAGVVIISTDSQVFKVGNGVDLYSNLPDGPSISGIATGVQNLTNVLSQLDVLDEDMVIFINNEMYTASTTTLDSINDRIAAILNIDTIQDADLDTIQSQFGLVDDTLTSADNGKLAIVTAHKMSPGVLPSSILSPLIDESVNIHIKSIDVYSDSNCTTVLDEINNNSTCFIKINAMHDIVDDSDLTYQLSTTLSNVTITNYRENIFKVITGNISIPYTTLTATVSYNTGSSELSVSYPCAFTSILVSVYGGIGSDKLRGVAIDSNNNIIVVGNTTSEGLGEIESLVIKFDSSLNILAKKIYGGSLADSFLSVATDSNDNIICGGYVDSEGLGSSDALVVKFDSDLNILAKKRYGGTNIDYFFGITVDNNDNIICCGTTTSEGLGLYDALIVKFDTNLNILARKRYGSTGTEQFRDATVDSNNNIYVCGYTSSEGVGNNECLIVKFDTNLNILAKKRYGGTGADILYGITIDSNNNIFTAGSTASEGLGSTDCLIIKFDSSLNILARKRYGGAGADLFMRLKADSNNNVIAVGYTSSEGLGSPENLIVKFDTNLNIISKKICGGTLTDNLWDVALDAQDNIITVGYTASDGAGSDDALTIKLNNDILSGTFTGTVLTNITFSDSNLTLANSALTLADSNLTSADSALTLADSNLTLADSNLSYESDVFI